MARSSTLSTTGRPRRRGALVGVLVALVIVVAVAGVAAGIAWNRLYRVERDVPAGQTVEIAIPKGASTQTIAETLARAGVVDNALMFRLKARDAGVDGSLQAGTYEMTSGIGYEAAFKTLQRGPQVVYVKVLIPEGFTGKKIAARLAKQAGFDENELLDLIENGAPRFADEHPYLAGAYRDSLEGFLFPATYRIKEGTSAEQVVEMMLDAFDANTADLDLSYAKSKNLTLIDVVTIASMIEGEAKLDEEYPLVASVVYNRLKAKMRLQLCMTVLYTLPKHKDSLTNEDLKTDSPYNTYLRKGLPPGPVGNPGRKTLDAAAHPKKTKYLYYVLTGKDGSHTFASNYAAFLKAKQVYKDTVQNQ